MVRWRGRGTALLGKVSPGSVSLGDRGRCPEDGQHSAGRAGHRSCSCSQECQRAAYGGATAAVSDVWGAPDSPRLGGHGMAHTCTGQVEAATGPPSQDGAASRVPRDGTGAATPGDVAPASRGMPSLRTAQRSYDAVQMPVPQSQVAEGPAGSGSAMETTRGGGIAAHHQRGPPVTHMHSRGR